MKIFRVVAKKGLSIKMLTPGIQYRCVHQQSQCQKAGNLFKRYMSALFFLFKLF